MPKKERQEKMAAFAMAKELDSEMTDEERERKLKSGMGLHNGVNKGEEQLFGAPAVPQSEYCVTFSVLKSGRAREHWH